MSILVFGASGQVATELQRQAEVTALGRASCDLMMPGAISGVIETYEPSVVINAAAYTAVDKAEEEEAQAMVLNAEAPGAMARACAARASRFVMSRPIMSLTAAATHPGWKQTLLRRETLMAAASWPASRRCWPRAGRRRSCARPGCSRPMGRISSRPCCA